MDGPGQASCADRAHGSFKRRARSSVQPQKPASKTNNDVCDHQVHWHTFAQPKSSGRQPHAQWCHDKLPGRHKGTCAVCASLHCLSQLSSSNSFS